MHPENRDENLLREFHFKLLHISDSVYEVVVHKFESSSKVETTVG